MDNLVGENDFKNQHGENTVYKQFFFNLNEASNWWKWRKPYFEKNLGPELFPTTSSQTVKPTNHCKYNKSTP